MPRIHPMGEPVIVAGTMVRALPGHKALVRAWVSTTMGAINPGGRQSPPLRLAGQPRGYQGLPGGCWGLKRAEGDDSHFHQPLNAGQVGQPKNSSHDRNFSSTWRCHRFTKYQCSTCLGIPYWVKRMEALDTFVAPLALPTDKNVILVGWRTVVL